MTNDWLIVFVDCWLMKIFLGGEGEWSDINKNGNDYVKTRSLKKKTRPQLSAMLGIGTS